MTPQILPDGNVCVDMGKPELFPWSSKAFSSKKIPFPLQLVHNEYLVTDVSMGNPHAVVFVDNLESFLCDGVFQMEGPKLSTYHEIFPDGTNAEFAQVSIFYFYTELHCVTLMLIMLQVMSPTHLRLEVWERGSGHTQACGTGACATVVAGVAQGHVKPNEWCRVSLPGGELNIRWMVDQGEDGHVFMSGPAVKVFRGDSEALKDMFSNTSSHS
jgi:diaminopimelate epimerase